jgi:hypothetical protein
LDLILNDRNEQLIIAEKRPRIYYQGDLQWQIAETSYAINGIESSVGISSGMGIRVM